VKGIRQSLGNRVFPLILKKEEATLPWEKEEKEGIRSGSDNGNTQRVVIQVHRMAPHYRKKRKTKESKGKRGITEDLEGKGGCQTYGL